MLWDEGRVWWDVGRCGGMKGGVVGYGCGRRGGRGLMVGFRGGCGEGDERRSGW